MTTWKLTGWSGIVTLTDNNDGTWTHTRETRAAVRITTTIAAAEAHERLRWYHAEGYTAHA